MLFTSAILCERSQIQKHTEILLHLKWIKRIDTLLVGDRVTSNWRSVKKETSQMLFLLLTVQTLVKWVCLLYERKSANPLTYCIICGCITKYQSKTQCLSNKHLAKKVLELGLFWSFWCHSCVSWTLLNLAGYSFRTWSALGWSRLTSGAQGVSPPSLIWQQASQAFSYAGDGVQRARMETPGGLLKNKTSTVSLHLSPSIDKK